MKGIFTGLIFTKYLQPQMFLFHWIRKETNTNNLFFLIKFMVLSKDYILQNISQ